MRISTLIDERGRDEYSKLSIWRIIYIKVPAQPIAKTVKIGLLDVTLLYEARNMYMLRMPHKRSSPKCLFCHG